uniref:Uncharacterized protein n=1 Tax=Rhizophagus irregularis (strain DAOM 181602 / DAOM 197198 / MUCL 43194) TaxID=747089 RepID=U9UXS1_RHIID
MLSQEQEKVAESRVKNMKIFQGVNTVAIEQVSTQYPLPLGNCSEYLPWEALLNGNHGSRNCSPMVIEVIVNEYERDHFASYVGRDRRDTPKLLWSRFMSDMMSGVFWPLGDTLEEARTRSWTLWVVDEE